MLLLISISTRLPSGHMDYFTPHEWESFRDATLILVASMIFFKCCQFIVSRYLDRNHLFGNFSLFGWGRDDDEEEENEEKDEKELSPETQWRISNEGTSLIHAFISGVWALYIFLVYKDEVLKSNFDNPLTQNLFYFTAGYLIVDVIDLLVHDFACRVFELLFHHFVILSAISAATFFVIFKGSLVVGLLMEVNSVFLHIRSLCNLYSRDKKSISFRIIALANIITFIVFRILVSMYLFYWMVEQTIAGVKFYVFVSFASIITTLLITNLILFYRLLAADGFLGKKRARKSEKTKKASVVKTVSISVEEQV